MALIIQNGNSIGVGVRVNLASASDTYAELAGVSVVSTDGSDAIFSSVASSIDVLRISGEMVGGNGIHFTSGTSFFALTNNASGYISGLTGDGVVTAASADITNYGTIIGTDTAITVASGAIYNYGTVSSPYGASFAAIYATSQGTVYNYGTLSGAVAVRLGNNSFSNFVYNAGTIRTDSGIVDNSQSSIATDSFINTGTMTSQGIVFQATGSVNVKLTNTGMITGLVMLGSGNNLWDSTWGQVFGQVSGGSAADTIVGGTNGGSINGGGGNDILYANPTQVAADGHVTTTLNGSLGINALYGGSAFTVFQVGNSNGGYNQIWGGVSQMAGVSAMPTTPCPSAPPRMASMSTF